MSCKAGLASIAQAAAADAGRTIGTTAGFVLWLAISGRSLTPGQGHPGAPMLTIRSLALLAAMCFTGAAQAQNMWSMPAGGCTPDSATILANRHSVSFGSVKHATGNVDSIVLLCPISRFVGPTTSWKLKLTYRDTTGTDPAAFVRAQLMGNAIGTAGSFNIAVVNSNSSPSTAVNSVSSAPFTHPFNFENNVYFVRLDMDRNSDTQNVIAYSVVLDGQGP